MSNVVSVQCSHCGLEFFRPTSRANEAKKKGWDQFCSPECISRHKTKSILEPCLTCGALVQRKLCEKKKSPDGRIFCSHSCAASYNNIHRPEKSLETREKVSKSLRERPASPGREFVKMERPCIVCGALFFPRKTTHICCSKACGQIQEFGSLPLAREEVITQIQELYESLGRTPSSKEVTSKLKKSAAKFFGSWNKTMKHLGITPNTRWRVRKKLTCKDGHRADSFSEKIIDDWLFEHEIAHAREKKYPEGKFTCDFFLLDTGAWVEYLGLLGHFKVYDAVVRIKEDMARRFKLTLLEITSSDLYPESKLEEVFGKYLPVTRK